ncbi:MAG: hypothetical protein ACRDZU_10865 [Acidimicrobiales bacterium]
MLGATIIAVIILVAIPVSIMMTGAIVAAILGWSATENGEEAHQGSELIELS